MGLSGDCTEPRQKAGFIYMCESFEALTQHLTISDTRNKTQTHAHAWNNQYG